MEHSSWNRTTLLLLHRQRRPQHYPRHHYVVGELEIFAAAAAAVLNSHQKDNGTHITLILKGQLIKMEVLRSFTTFFEVVPITSPHLHYIEAVL